MKTLDSYCVNEDFTIREVMETFENNNERVAIVRNGSDKVVGVVSQGDIIRALTSGMDIYSRVQQIIQPSFLYLHHIDYDRICRIFMEKKITLLPIVDENFNLVDVITLGDVFHYLKSEGDEKK